MATASAAPVLDRDYGAKVTSVEPGGIEFVPLTERHGSPVQLAWTWASPNLEFATIFVGVLGVSAFGLSFSMTALAIVLGTGLGAISQGVLSTWGPQHGLAQMVLGRSAFGYLGNILPAGLMSITAGIGWFAVNSVSGALALNTLLGLAKVPSLLIVVVAQIAIAFFGHNLVQVFERYAFPVLAVAFIIASVAILAKSHPTAHATGGLPTLGGFLIEAGSAFGYAAGWNPYASDYTRYLRPDVKSKLVGIYAGVGIFLSCTVLEIVGAASATIGGADPHASITAQFTHSMPTFVADITLLAIALGAVSANVINIYSGAMAFLAMGISMPFAWRRAITALVFGAIGLVVAISALDDAGSKYESFLLVISYWIGPWLGIVFVDRWLRRGSIPAINGLVTSKTYQNWAGPIAMIIGAAVSIYLFSNQTKYVGVLPNHYPSFGDITFEVGFLLSGGLYYFLRRFVLDKPGSPASQARSEAVGTTR